MAVGLYPLYDLVLDTLASIPTILTLGTWPRNCQAEIQPTDTMGSFGRQKTGERASPTYLGLKNQGTQG